MERSATPYQIALKMPGTTIIPEAGGKAVVVVLPDARPDPQHRDDHPDMDGAVLNKNYISITPLICDMTDYHTIDELKKWRLDKEVQKYEKTVRE